jgi:uncharacterized protein
MKLIRKSRAYLPFVLALATLLMPAFLYSNEAANGEYQKEFDKFKLELIASRKQNWIPLVGLFWLKDGANSFGSDAGNAIVLPPGTIAPHAGTFTLLNGNVTIQVTSGVQAKIDGKVAANALLQSDDTDKATNVEISSLMMHVIKRGERVGIRVKDLNNTKAKTYPGPVFYPVNLQYRVTAKWVPASGKEMMNIPNVLGDVTPVPVSGVVVFTLHGQEYRLTDAGDDPSKGLSFVFNDLTKKTDTYPGGRFLDTDPVKDGKVVIDFNYAYNPPCSVTPYATCPLAPAENRLQVAIPVGEKYDRKSPFSHHNE